MDHTKSASEELDTDKTPIDYEGEQTLKDADY